MTPTLIDLDNQIERVHAAREWRDWCARKYGKHRASYLAACAAVKREESRLVELTIQVMGKS